MMVRFGITLIAITTVTAPAVAQTDVQAAGQTFRTRCLSCHQPPDTSLAMDRAWLDQIQRTA